MTHECWYCYIIEERFFYFNHFSLIIFYRSVWLGFELFGLWVQVCCQLVQFTLASKGYDNHHCHNKAQTGNRSVDDVMPRGDGLKIWKILKKIHLSSDHGVGKLGVRPWCWEVGGPTMVLGSWGSDRWGIRLNFSDLYQRRWIEI